ncbi:mRNA export factor Gle1 [Anopheles maculipalpis]|uniref:mRNA export factor Gle1 n=1 Tax=Anopheles maculipalpis TaxID=1496333 RepID=UPI002158B255|nr:mRNA export factor Gle1 [Anopheles maculipalpis]
MASKHNSTFNVEELLSGFDSMKISALRNAAKLSPLIKERTIGPDCVDLSQKKIIEPTPSPGKVETNDATKENNPNVSNEVPTTHGTPKSVEKKKATVTQFTASVHNDATDCAAVQLKLHQQDIERQRLASVQKTLAERQTKIRLADEEREAQLAKNLQEAVLNAARKEKDTEQRLLNAIKEQEQLAQEASARRQAEIEQEYRRLNDIQAQLKRRQEEMRRRAQLLETLRTYIGQFRVGTETFTKALTVIGVQHATKFTNQKKAVRMLQKDFELLLQTVNANQEVSQTEVDQAADFCKLLDQVNAEVTEILAQIETSQKQQEQEKLEQAKASEVPAAQDQPVQQTDTKPTDSTDSVGAGGASETAAVPAIQTTENEPFFQPVSPECLQFYNEIKTFYEQHQTAVKQLMDDPSMKTYRFNCQKAINVPVNAISAVNREHFIDKYNKLAALLSGQNVKAGDGVVSINGHPLGRTYCTMLLAKKFVSQADTSISSNASAAFPVAAIAVALWQRFPDFGRFFLAYLHRECPYLVPYYLPQLEGQSQEEFLKTLGYRFADGGVLEKQDQYLKRMSGLARLYAAVIITIPRKDDPTPHPHGIEYGWRWLTNILNRFPQPDICATLILEFLQTAGSDLHAVYGNQFIKVLQVLRGDYMTALNRIDTGGPKARLEGLIGKILTEGRIERPEGVMSVNFW